MFTLTTLIAAAVGYVVSVLFPLPYVDNYIYATWAKLGTGIKTKWTNFSNFMQGKT